eukprot:403374129
MGDEISNTSQSPSNNKRMKERSFKSSSLIEDEYFIQPPQSARHFNTQSISQKSGSQISQQNSFTNQSNLKANYSNKSRQENNTIQNNSSFNNQLRKSLVSSKNQIVKKLAQKQVMTTRQTLSKQVAKDGKNVKQIDDSDQDSLSRQSLIMKSFHNYTLEKQQQQAQDQYSSRNSNLLLESQENMKGFLSKSIDGNNQNKTPNQNLLNSSDMILQIDTSQQKQKLVTDQNKKQIPYQNQENSQSQKTSKRMINNGKESRFTLHNPTSSLKQNSLTHTQFERNYLNECRNTSDKMSQYNYGQGTLNSQKFQQISQFQTQNSLRIKSQNSHQMNQQQQFILPVQKSMKINNCEKIELFAQPQTQQLQQVTNSSNAQLDDIKLGINFRHNNNNANLSSSLNHDIKSYDDRLRVMDKVDDTYHIQYDDDLLQSLKRQTNDQNYNVLLDSDKFTDRQPFKELRNFQQDLNGQYPKHQSDNVYVVPSYNQPISDSTNLLQQQTQRYRNDPQQIMYPQQHSHNNPYLNPYRDNNEIMIISERENESSSYQSYFYNPATNNPASAVMMEPSKNSLITPHSFKIQDSSYTSQRQQDLQNFIQSEVQKILASKSPLRYSNLTSQRRSLERYSHLQNPNQSNQLQSNNVNHNNYISNTHRGSTSGTHEYSLFEEVKIGDINIGKNLQSNFKQNNNQSITQIQRDSNLTKDRISYTSNQATMFHQRHKSLTQNHNQNIDDFNLENCLPDDLKKTVHLNVISHPTSIESLKQSRLLTHQRVLRHQKYTPSKIIDFDRKWQRYTKKELHKYVEIMQRDLIEVRRKLSDFNQDDVKHNDFRITQIQKSAEQEPLKLNQNSINKEAQTQAFIQLLQTELQEKSHIINQKEKQLLDMHYLAQTLIKTDNENHLYFLEYQKQLLQLQNQFKDSYQAGERNAGFKMEIFIKEKLALLRRFDKNQEIIQGLRVYLDQIQVINVQLQDQEENLEEFDSEYNTQKAMQILQLTTKHSKNLNNFNNDKMTPRNKASVSPRQMNFTFQNSFINQKLDKEIQTMSIIDNPIVSQEKYDKLEESYKTKLEKLKCKYCEMKLLNKTLQQQNINKEKILQNLKKTNIKTTTGFEDSFDRADTLFDNQNDTQKSFNINDNLEGNINQLRNDYNSTIEKLKNLSGVRDEDRNLIIDLVKSFFNKSQKNPSLQEQSKLQPQSNLDPRIIMDLVVQAKSLSKSLNPYILSKNQSLIELFGVINKIHDSVQSIQQQKKPLNLKDKNSATKLLKQSKSQGSNINLDYYYFANNPSKEEEITINLYKNSEFKNIMTKEQNKVQIPDLSNQDERQLKALIQKQCHDMQDLWDQLYEVKAHNEILMNFNQSNQDIRSPKSDQNSIYKIVLPTINPNNQHKIQNSYYHHIGGHSVDLNSVQQPQSVATQKHKKKQKCHTTRSKRHNLEGKVKQLLKIKEKENPNNTETSQRRDQYERTGGNNVQEMTQTSLNKVVRAMNKKEYFTMFDDKDEKQVDKTEEQVRKENHIHQKEQLNLECLMKQYVIDNTDFMQINHIMANGLEQVLDRNHQHLKEHEEAILLMEINQ